MNKIKKIINQILDKILRDERAKQRGYLLIEAMIAISILLMGFLGVLRLVSYSLSLNRVVSDQFTANFLAIEGVELTRNLIGRNVLKNNGPWNEGFNDGCYGNIDYSITEASFAFSSVNGVSCLSGSNAPLKYDSGVNFYNYNNGLDTNFYRTIEIKMLDSDTIKIKSIVKWANRGGSFEIDAEDYFFNWY